MKNKFRRLYNKLEQYATENDYFGAFRVLNSRCLMRRPIH